MAGIQQDIDIFLNKAQQKVAAIGIESATREKSGLYCYDHIIDIQKLKSAISILMCDDCGNCTLTDDEIYEIMSFYNDEYELTILPIADFDNNCLVNNVIINSGGYLIGPAGPTGPIGLPGATGATGATGAAGVDGVDGEDGWEAITALVTDGLRIVARVTGWAGGTGTPPTSGYYIGPSGFVINIADATDVRGPQGLQGIQGIQGLVGADGENAFVYAGYADDNVGTGFTSTFDSTKYYIAILTTTTEILSPGVSDFVGLWFKWKGEVGPAFALDARGDLADRTLYDSAIPPFAFLAEDTGNVYFKESAVPGDWSGPVSFVGDKGWSPVYAIVDDGERRVYQLVDWVGGDGAVPATGDYVGPVGLVPDIASAVDIRGSQGRAFFPDAEDVFANRSTYDTELKDFIFYATDLGLVYIKLSDTSGDWSTGVQWQGPQGDQGVNAYTAVTSSFVQPSVSGFVVVSVADTSWMAVGQTLFVETGGNYEVAGIIDEVTVSLENIGAFGNAIVGATIPNASKVSPSGPEGPVGIGSVGNNGLNTDTPGEIRLGGTMVEDTTLDFTGAYDFTTLDVGVYSLNAAYGYISTSNDLSIVSDTWTFIQGEHSYLSINDNAVVLHSHKSGASKYELNLNPFNGWAKFIDSTVNPAGLQYNADYSATYTSRSLVDKAYVTAAIAIAVPTATLSINGNTYDLSANRSWTTGLADTGVLTSVGITYNSASTINIGAVVGQVVNNETNPSIPTVTSVSYAGATNVTVTTVGSGAASYIMLSSAGVISFQNTFPTSTERKAKIYIGKVGHPTGTINASAIGNEPDYVTSPIAQLKDLYKAIGFINNGVTASANGANLNFNIATGVISHYASNYITDKTKPNEITVSAATPQSFLYRTQTGAGGGFVSLIDPTMYDLAGTITAIGGSSNQATNQYIYCVPGLGFIVQYGQTIYTTLTDAIAAVGKETFTVYSSLVTNAILIGVVSVQKGATTLNNTTQARFFTADRFGQAGGSTAGVSVATQQTTYNNSIVPQIIVTDTLGADTWRNGRALDTSTVMEWQNIAGTTTASILGNGTGAFTALGIGTGTTAPASALQVVTTSTSSLRGGIFDQYSTGTDGSRLFLRKSRNTFASPNTIVTGDTIGNLFFSGHEGTAFNDSASIMVTSVGTIGTGRVPSKMEFRTSTDAATSVITTALTLDQAQGATFAGQILANGTITAPSSFTLTSGATTISQATITYASNTTLKAGDGITGTGIPASTYVKQILSATSCILTALATATNTGLTFTITPASAGTIINQTVTSGSLNNIGLLINPVMATAVTGKAVLISPQSSSGTFSIGLEIATTGERHISLLGGSNATLGQYYIGVGNSSLGSAGSFFIAKGNTSYFQIDSNNVAILGASTILSGGSFTVPMLIGGGGGSSTGSYAISLFSAGATSSGGWTYTSGNGGYLSIGNSGGSNQVFAPASGTGAFNTLNIIPVYNQTGTSSGTVRGIYYAPTVTAVLGTHNAIESTSGNWVIGGATNAPVLQMHNNGSTALTALASTTTGVLHVGSGFVSTMIKSTGTGTDALLSFANSTGTARGYIKDNYSGSSEGSSNFVIGISTTCKLMFNTDGSISNTNNNAYYMPFVHNTIRSGNNVLGTSFQWTNGCSNTNTTGTRSLVVVNNDTGGSIVPTSGSGNWNYLFVNPVTINQTGSTGEIALINLSTTTVTSVTGKLYGLRSQIVASPTGGGTAWNIYADGTANNAFAGLTKFGAVTTPVSLVDIAAGTTSIAPLKLTAGTNLTTAVTGAIEYDGNNFFLTEASTIRKSVQGVVYTQTAYKTVANTVTETSLLNSTTTLPANFFKVGKMVRIQLFGFLSAAASPTIRIRVKLGSTTILDTAVVSSGNGTNDTAVINAAMTCYTTGASGTISGQGVFQDSGGGANIFPMSTTATTVIDTTASQVLDVTVTWGTASASNTISITDGAIQILN